MILEAKNITDVEIAITGPKAENQTRATIFIDIDDTLITPCSKIFRYSSPYKNIITELKDNKAIIPNFEKIISNWRLQRNIMLLDNNWPELINKLKKHHAVYALSKVESGAIGSIASMELWRYTELKTLGIEFSRNIDLENHGMFLTGALKKSEVVFNALNILNPSKIILIDDLAENLYDLEDMCQQHNILFTGILFRGLEKLTDSPNLQVAAFQRQYLLDNAQWLEDEQAEKLLA